jgi:polysaccharide pyruvyl transferase WcaK-like protein
VSPGLQASSPESKRLVEQLAKGLGSVGRRHGAHLLFLPSYATAIEGDQQLCALVLEKSGAPGQVEVVRDPRLYAAIVGGLDLMVGGRMHPAILAAGAGTPVVGLGYNPKFDGFFELLGQGDRVLPVETMLRSGGPGELEALVQRALDGGPASADRVEALRQALRTFNHDLTAPLTPTAVPA